MPPPRPSQASQRRATQSQNEHVYEKTGVTLPDNGERDEYGFEDPNIFSSPEKEANGANGYDRGTPEDSDEQDMDLDDGSEMGPATIRKLQERKNRPSLPRARSPVKTNLKSPARRNPHLGPTSSPTRGSIVEAPQHSSPQPVKRRLDFSKDQPQLKPATNGNSRLNGSRAPNGKPNGRSNHSEESGDDGEDDGEDQAVPRGKRKQPAPADDEDEDEEGSEEGNEEPMQVLDMGDDDVDQSEPDQVEPEAEEEEEEEDANEQIEEEETEEVQPQPAARRGRKPKEPPAKKVQSQPPVTEQVKDEASKKKRGRPAKNAPQEEAASSSPKRRRSERGSLGNADEVPEDREPKRQRTEKASSKAASAAALKVKSKAKATAAPPPAQKGKPGRKRKSSGVGVDSPVVQRGPPLPRARGLVSMRREGTDSARTTRSGRISVKPLEFWKGEHYEFDDDPEEVYGDKRNHFVFNKVKGIVRAEEAEPQLKAKKGRGRPSGRPKGGRRSSAAAAAEDPNEAPDEWEDDPGRVVGECFYWYPEYQDAPPEDEDRIQVVEEELAISSAAINLRDIKDATFKFAKTLTLPFFGAGVVDLPPGSEKHPKNSRKMQMVFFVHTGSVTVTIADVNTFRITKGGMWFVPRGNRYEIKNEGDKTARLFFAQGCEVHWQPEAQD
ncbi:mitotic fidelity of chromosome transmission-related protein [Diatrype stigma]|uniref:CENP-C homolog n=1 Tax=Diatrype stigma TaxID=117547 RepID=A0AAN9V2M1_9PEZI